MGRNALSSGDYVLYDYSTSGASLSGSFNSTPVWISAVTKYIRSHSRHCQWTAATKESFSEFVQTPGVPGSPSATAACGAVEFELDFCSQRDQLQYLSRDDHWW